MKAPFPSSKAWHQEQLFDCAEGYFNALIKSIATATISIELDYYIFNFDKTGKSIIRALSEASKRGVVIRVLLDGIGSSDSGLEAALALESQAISVKIYHPLPWQISHYHRSLISGNTLLKAFRFISRINHRDHRKFCIIDGQQLWTGSLNISDQHLSLDLDGSGWRDYGVMVSGSPVLNIQQKFNQLWQTSLPHNNVQNLSQKLSKNFGAYWGSFNQRERKQKNNLLKEHIHQAQQRIWIVSAYFAPSRRLIKALKLAAKRGIDVRIIVPQCSDVPLFPQLTNTYYHDLLVDGIHLYEYLPRFLHAKAAIIDDFYLLGSSNFNHRSSLHDLELDIVLSQTKSKKQLENYMLTDRANAYEVVSRDIQQSVKQLVLGFISKLIRYWM